MADDPKGAVFGQRAGREARLSLRAKPAVRGIVLDVTRVDQRDEDVDIQ